MKLSFNSISSLFMNLSVLLFFLHTTLATAVVGGVFVKKPGDVAKFFGLGLLIEAVAFAAWALAVMMPGSLATLVTVGAVLTLVSFLFFLKAGTDGMAPSMRSLVLILGVVLVAVTFVAGRWIYPTPKFVSDEGFLMFNLAPMVQLMYITVMVLVAFPVIEKVGAMFNSRHAACIKYLLAIQVVGAVILITSMDTMTLYVAGWGIGLAYFALWTKLLFKKDIWQS